jgi:hypothetical protein
MRLWRCPVLIKNLVARLRASQRGAIIIETAFYVPAFCLLVFGGMDVASYVQTSVKASRISANYGDMIGEGGQALTERQLVDMMRNFQALADPNGRSPNIATDGRLIITAFRGELNSGVVSNRVLWRYCLGGLSNGGNVQRSIYPAVGQFVPTLDGGLVLANSQTAVVAEVYLRHKPTTTFFFRGNDVLSDRAIYISRMTNLTAPLADPDNVNISSFNIAEGAGC